MRPICGSCSHEMKTEGKVIQLNYNHTYAPVDHAKAYKFVCPNCGNNIYVPLAYGTLHKNAPVVEVISNN